MIAAPGNLNIKKLAAALILLIAVLAAAFLYLNGRGYLVLRTERPGRSIRGIPVRAIHSA